MLFERPRQDDKQLELIQDYVVDAVRASRLYRRGHSFVRKPGQRYRIEKGDKFTQKYLLTLHEQLPLVGSGFHSTLIMKQEFHQQ